MPENIKKIFKALRTYWEGEIGIHAHDNMRRALMNTIEAYRNGFLWLDSTVQGMGRGPGNTKTEDLVFEIKDINSSNIDFLPLIDLVQKDFYNLNNMNEISFDKDTTTQKYTKRTFVYDFLSSLRQKINDPLGKRKKP